MTAKHNSGKVTLGMIKGKPITMSVPVIRYHASDDELEELYLDTDEEKQLTPESETSLGCSPSKSAKNKDENSDSLDGNLSEGSPLHDRWKVLSEIKGKIAKTFEEKLLEMKSDKKKKKCDRKYLSVSDSEDVGDTTPIEESLANKQGQESDPTIHFQKSNSSRFVAFSEVKVGIKTKSPKVDSIESGVEAEEFNNADIDITDKIESGKHNINFTDFKTIMSKQTLKHPTVQRISTPAKIDFTKVYSQFKNDVMYCTIYQFLTFVIAVGCSYNFIPLPDYFIGFLVGIIFTMVLYNFVARIKNFLTTPLPENPEFNSSVSILEIPAIPEHSAIEKFEGWLNEWTYTYNPENYHVARTNAVFFKLEKNNLQVMETGTRVPKRAIWDEPKPKFKFCRKRIYNLTDAEVNLLPEGLTKRRRWSKKYPISIIFKEKAIIEDMTVQESSDDETQSSDINNSTGVVNDDVNDNDSQSNVEKGDDNIQMIIFARCDREKEDWYRRLTAAVNNEKKKYIISSMDDNTNSSSTQQLSSESKSSSSSTLELSNEQTYNNYMLQYLEKDTTTTLETDSYFTTDLIWFNCIFGRILFDMHKCPDAANLIQYKIQRKLSNIKLPYFMESLSVTEVVIGQGAPTFNKVTKPVIDDRGLWLDLDVSYKGGFTMTVETKLNLMKLTRAGSISAKSCDTLDTDNTNNLTRSPMFDSDVEDSPETSTEDDDSSAATPNSSKEVSQSMSSGKKFLSMVDKLTTSKYFQHAAEVSYIRRAMEGVSNTEIRLMISVSEIEGCLSLNIPPPPSDRLWYGFKPVPKITLTVKPALGERTVNIVYITKWIETKLLREFEKVVVLPNMDDIVIPLCPNYPYH